MIDPVAMHNTINILIVLSLSFANYSILDMYFMINRPWIRPEHKMLIVFILNWFVTYIFVKILLNLE